MVLSDELFGVLTTASCFFQYTDEHEFSLRRDVGLSSTLYIRLAVILKSVVQRYVGK